MSNNVTQKLRLSKKAACIRRTNNTSKIKRKQMVNSNEVPVILKEMSGKFNELINNIKSIDIADKKKYGRQFKHLIYTDIRESGYGVKALTGFLINAGFEFSMGKQRKIMKRNGIEIETLNGETVYLEKSPIFGGSNRFAILQSVPLWKNPTSVKTKKRILEVFNSRPDNVYGELLRLIVLDSKYKEGIDLFDVRYVHLLEPPIATSDLKQAVGRATRFCGQKGLEFMPKKGWTLDVFIYNVELPGRPPFTKLEEQKVDGHSLMLKESGIDIPMLNFTEQITRLAIQTAVDYDLNYKINNFNIEDDVIDAVEAIVEAQEGGEITEKCGKRKSKLFPYTRIQIIDAARALGLKIGKGARRIKACKLLEKNPELLTRLLQGDSYFPSPISVLSKKETANVNIKSLSFNQFQQTIVNDYNNFRWNAPIIKSGCDTIVTAPYGKPVTFSKTQDFIRHYLTPQSPFKGLLAWHSVGTGKTCMAIAAATSTFESAGYNILWVTRNALVSDVYKNIFGAVCSVPLIKKIAEDGLEIPTERSKAKRLLSRSWFPPITYRMLQNALKQENELGRSLFAKNNDPLKKTFLIIDEIHKLQDGDLNPSESADFKFIQSAIWNSYEKSGNDSVRLLLMTATPITDSPAELFEIINTLIPKKEERLPSIDDFRQSYTDNEGTITMSGRDFFQAKAKGLISYLNREYDPTTFTQPRFHNIIVPIGEAKLPTMEELLNNCTTTNTTGAKNCTRLTEDLETEIEKIENTDLSKKEKKTAIAELKRIYKPRIKTCKTQEKTMMKNIINKATTCFKKTRKNYNDLRKLSQLYDAEACFGKPTPSQFVKQSDFTQAVKEKFSQAPSSIDSIKAVLNLA
jgi:superfamily II DNA or RNA helicase